MIISFCAVVKDERQRKNLCDCVGILGAKAEVNENTVCVDYEGSEETAEKLMELFKQCRFNGFSMIC